jgi:HD-GYP domain-containing protein (c-di-GMP phosphodiesterase class II)
LEEERFSSYFVVPLVAKGQPKGVLELFHHEPILADPELRDFFDSLAAQTAIAMDNGELFEGLKRSNLELTRAYDAVIESWARSLELREEFSHGHAKRTADMAFRFATMMALNETELPHIRRGALLHDIGMIGIPEVILLKKGPLTAEEREVVNTHPRQAHDLLMNIHFLAPALDIPSYHHEHWDGSGYPNGMKGDQIPLVARLFTVVDVWDALTNDRSYRQAWSRNEAVEYLREQAGKLFDPDVVEKFLRELPQVDIRFAEKPTR